jgi:hypothetical protein
MRLTNLAAEDRTAAGVRDQTGPEPDAHEIAHRTREYKMDGAAASKQVWPACTLTSCATPSPS